MKIAAGILMLSAGLCSWMVLADEPQVPAPAPAPAQPPAPAAQPAAVPTPAPNAPSSGATKPAAATGATTPATTPAKTGTSEIVNIAATEALIKKMRGRGYKPINRNGILVFCRTEGQIGTHFERSRCNTIDELKNAERTGQEYTQQIQQQASPTPFNPVGEISKP